MANQFSTLHVKSAVKSHNKFDLSQTHLTTLNFGQIVPLLAEETIAGDKFNVNGKYFSRMAPLAKPTYGQFSFHTVASFVPYHQIADGIDAFMAGNLSWEGEIPDSRYITWRELVLFLVDNSSTVTDASYDFAYTTGTGTFTKKKLTEKGKYILKVLNSLGYNIPQNVDMQTSSDWNTQVGLSHLSALPLLAFFKAYNDFMSQSQRFNLSELTKFLKQVKHNITVSGKYNASSHEITKSGIQLMFDNLLLMYENGYFTSAWRQPNSPLGLVGDMPNPTIAGVPANAYDSVGFDFGDNFVATPLVSGTSATAESRTYIYQRSLDFLKSFDDWVRRNNYSGSRAVQRIYSRFGVKTDDYRSNYAHVISSEIIPVQVGDITSQADTSTAALGDYAGKGILNGGKGFSFEANDYGMLFVFGYYTVSPMYSFGCDRTVLRTSPLDYYNPEFDGLGAEAISYAELQENPRCPSGDTYIGNAVYGFTERYNSYRYGRDKITGEFRKLVSDTADINDATAWNVWHTGRDLSAVRAAGEMLAQSPSMVALSPTRSEYNRMFNVTSGDEDKFYLTAQFNISAVRPMLSLNQVPRLGEGDTVLPKNGNVVN